MHASEEAGPTFLMRHSEIVWLGGADALSFLDRLSTNRIDDLPADAGRATAITTDEGRVVDFVGVHVAEDGLAIATSGPGAGRAVSDHLRRYVLRDNVRVTEASAQVASARLFGPRAAAVASAFSGLDAAGLAPGGWRRLEDGYRWLLRHPEPGPAGFDVVVPSGLPAEVATRALVGCGATETDASGYTRMRVDTGLPAWGHEIAGDANPLELGLRSVVDFTKGCYLGQEVVARIDSYDKVRRALVRLQLERPVPEGARVFAVRSADEARHGGVPGGSSGANVAGAPRPGNVTTVTALPDRACFALALVPLAMAGAETLRVQDSEGDVTAHVVARIELAGRADDPGA